MTDDWYAEKIAPDGAPEDGCHHPDEVNTLKKYLNGEFTSVTEAAYAITRPAETSSHPLEAQYSLWGLLTDAFLELPASQTMALFNLEEAIERLPTPELTEAQRDPENTDPPRKESNDFGHWWFQVHDMAIQTFHTVTEPDERGKMRAQHMKMAELEVRFAQAGFGSFDLHRGYVYISNALERSEADLDFEVPAAAAYIVGATRYFFVSAVTEKSHDALAEDHDLWKREKWMSLARWSFWKGRFAEVARKEEGGLIDSVTHVAASKAYLCMDELEAESRQAVERAGGSTVGSVLSHAYAQGYII